MVSIATFRQTKQLSSGASQFLLDTASLMNINSNIGDIDKTERKKRPHEPTKEDYTPFYRVFRRAQHTAFLLGISYGLVLSLIFEFLTSWKSSKSTIIQTKQIGHSRFSLDNAFEKYYSEEKNERERPEKSTMLLDTHFDRDNDSVTRSLEKKIRILCWIMTGPQNLDVKAIGVKKTWGKRCNVLIFFSSVTNSSFPTIGLNVSEGRQHLTAKSMKAFRYVYEHYKDQADWFMKADDDTYVIVENLRYLLKDYKPSDPAYFGQLFGQQIVKQGYYSGGAGYVLSKEALTRLYIDGKNPKLCKQNGGEEDIEIGRCMEYLGIKTVNTNDNLGRTRFHCFGPDLHLSGQYPEWYYIYDANNGTKKGIEGISDYAISFHMVTSRQMYEMDVYIYHLRVYGIDIGYLNLYTQPGL